MGLAHRIAPRGTRRRKVATRIRGMSRSSQQASAKTNTPERPPDTLPAESTTLKRSWAKHKADALDQYLVSGYQNPRINAQSMLIRHHLIRKLFGDEFDSLMHEELQHCVRATEALRERARELDVTMGSYVNPERRAAVQQVSEVISDWEDTYERRWAQALAGRSVQPLRVLEFACGSANDYRFFDRYGIAQYLDYTGVDLNDANIGNAHRRFPDVNFEVRSVLDLPYEDNSFDYVLASNILEHLSLEGMEQAVAQACRLASRGLVLTFFRMVDEPEHIVRPVRAYYKNTLSRSRMRALVEKEFDTVQDVRIRDLLHEQFDYPRSYNKIAWSMFAEHH